VHHKSPAFLSSPEPSAPSRPAAPPRPTRRLARSSVCLCPLSSPRRDRSRHPVPTLCLRMVSSCRVLASPVAWMSLGCVGPSPSRVATWRILASPDESWRFQSPGKRCGFPSRRSRVQAPSPALACKNENSPCAYDWPRTGTVRVGSRPVSRLPARHSWRKQRALGRTAALYGYGALGVTSTTTRKPKRGSR